ncbi:MAG TPA: hypothetical protein VK864_02570 [Longimicrobiales bacterium]|nr:hypothetical protein [Longimicrobiales bacterium]
MSVAAFVPGCARSSNFEPIDAEVIRWGSSFGMCAGYCREELEITSDRVRLTRTGWDAGQFPPRVEERSITEAQWNALRSRVEQGDILTLDSIHGCPDCADGGAEWVEVQTNDRRRRVTFEFGRGPGELQPVLALLRPLRATFPPR